jgi:uncharacterized protein
MNIAELKREAESGNLVSQSVLGICYLYGRDVAVNHQEAFRLLSIAADRGASRAVVNLAQLFAKGLGTPKDLPEAIRLYRAVQKVEVRAQLELARIYSQELGFPADPKAARRYYSGVAKATNVVDDPSTAALVGAVTFDEIKEAKAYLADTER